MINLRKNKQAMITINGQTFYGDNVSIKNGNVTIDGTDHTPPGTKNITISVKGDLKSIDIDSCNKLDVTGNIIGNVKTISGDIEIGGYVHGDVGSVSGDIKCGDISGNVKTISGDIKNKK